MHGEVVSGALLLSKPFHDWELEVVTKLFCKNFKASQFKERRLMIQSERNLRTASSPLVPSTSLSR